MAVDKEVVKIRRKIFKYCATPRTILEISKHLGLWSPLETSNITAGAYASWLRHKGFLVRDEKTKAFSRDPRYAKRMPAALQLG